MEATAEHDLGIRRRGLRRLVEHDDGSGSGIFPNRGAVMAMRFARPNWVPMWVWIPNEVARPWVPLSKGVLRARVRPLNWST